MNASIGYLRDRSRRSSSFNENSFQERVMQSIFLNENTWRSAFIGDHQPPRRNSRLATFTGYLQCIYEKSRIHYLFPILLLIAYSVLGGFIFYTIESPNEEIIIKEKSNFIEHEKEALLDLVHDIRSHLRFLNDSYGHNMRRYNIYKRNYRKYAMNKLHTKVYWYTLSMYYLTEHETHKAMALRPKNPEAIWRAHFENNYGRINALRNYTEQLGEEVSYVDDDGWIEDVKNRIENATQRFELLTGLHNVLTPVWTFWNAMFLAVTTYTTIGYGNITAKTKLGKLAAMVYAVIGIPLVLMILHKLGRFFLSGLEIVWDYILRIMEFCYCPGSGKRLRLSEQERISEMPLVLAIGVAFAWMFLCAAIFLHFEDEWDYFKSFYFFFCSLTTIGYGDVTPTNSEDMFLIFGLIMVGLSLVSMCINVIQLKLEKLFEELLLMMMEEYSADPEARPLRGEHIGMIDMWRVWKRRRGRMRAGGTKAASAAKVAAKDAAGRAGENFAKVMKVFPFVRRRERQVLIEQITHRLRLLNKATQTDMPWYFHPIHEEPWTETSSLSNSPDYSPTHPPTRVGFFATRAVPECVSILTSMQPSTAPSPSPPSSSASTRPTSPTEEDEKKELGSMMSTDGSIRSEPTTSKKMVYPPDFDPSRRWTFVETGKAPRGMPRGLVVPHMYTSTQDTQEETRRLIAELDARMKDARSILTPSPYTSSSNSFL